MLKLLLLVFVIHVFYIYILVLQAIRRQLRQLQQLTISRAMTNVAAMEAESVALGQALGYVYIPIFH